MLLYIGGAIDRESVVFGVVLQERVFKRCMFALKRNHPVLTRSFYDRIHRSIAADGKCERAIG